ncbi:biopolymer transporter ExbD [Myxococcota bacterium]|nr:biopolymer transporter ExbD [Myxococcota bacterium]MBU1382539.1 biopolymer transporter ExbD [Myxococcota bacterium]MBU1497431.1 biopolymer transporter ExbD [Myxococcota bacterium]
MNLNYDSGARSIAEMNLTPLIDVMMVLMIIFMVTSPVEPSGIDLNLPDTKGAPIADSKDKLTIFINKEEKVVLTKGENQRIETKIESLVTILKTNFPGIKSANVRADKDLKYQKVMELLVEVRKSGITGIGLMTSNTGKKDQK